MEFNSSSETEAALPVAGKQDGVQLDYVLQSGTTIFDASIKTLVSFRETKGTYVVSKLSQKL